MSNYLTLFILWGAFVLVVVALGISFRESKARLLNGMLANLAILIFAAATLNTQVIVNNHVYTVIVTVVFVSAVLLFILLYLSAGVLLLWNAFIVWRKESHTVANMLTLILGIAFLSSSFVYSFIGHEFPSLLANFILYTADALVLYAGFWFLNFLTSFMISKLIWPKLNKQYIIILGAGLIDGQRVTPLLAGRLDKAIQFRNRQVNKTGNDLTMITSGGKGSDEHLSEAEAMRNYLLEQAIPESIIKMDTKSKNTFENMEFSKNIVDELGFDRSRGLFATSDFHTFRATGFAHYVGLPIDGIGAKTSRFFVPNAFLREYVAILMAHKKFHAIVITLLVAGAIGATVIQNMY